MSTYSISGQALAGSTMTLTGAASASVTAGPTGLYSFTNLAPGAYTVTPSRPGIAFNVPFQNLNLTSANLTGVNFYGTSVGSQGSTYKIQDVINRVMAFGDIEPVLNVGGFSLEPALTIANDVFNEICSVNFPHKWNRGELPQFYTWSWQQDYALLNPDYSSVYEFEWLEKGMAIDISSTQIPKPWCRVECGRDLPKRTGTYMVNGGTELGDPGFLISWMLNSELYYGTWGAGITNNPSWGNNPMPGSFYMSPLGVYVITATWAGGVGTFTLNQLPQNIAIGTLLEITGALPSGYSGNWVVTSIPASAQVNPQVTVTMATNPGTYESGGSISGTGVDMPANPINQIIDANGNLLVVTTYGAEGTQPPLAPVGAYPGTQVSGTGAQTIWTVVDPVGMGVRILNVPSQTGITWQFNIDAQFVPPKFTSLDQTLAPLPDKYEPFFRAGFIAQCYRYSDEPKIRAKFQTEWPAWQKSLSQMRETQDRELEEWSFIPERTVMGSGRSRNTFRGAAWPFPYPVIN